MREKARKINSMKAYITCGNSNVPTKYAEAKSKKKISVASFKDMFNPDFIYLRPMCSQHFNTLSLLPLFANFWLDSHPGHFTDRERAPNKYWMGLGGLKSQFGYSEVEKNLFPLPGIELISSDVWPKTQSLHQLSFPYIHIKQFWIQV
jgi:hypothetical protein